MKISLDVAALEALFPAGSEARIQLQSAVVQEFANRHIKLGAIDQIRKLLEPTIKASSEEMKAELLKHIVTNGYSYNPQIMSVKAGSGLDVAMTNLLKSRFDESVMELINTKIEDLIERYSSGEEITRYVENIVSRKFSEATRAEIHREADRLVNEKLAALITKA